MNVLLAAAALLPLYRTRWGGRVPHRLAETPFMTAWTWRRAIRRRPGESLARTPVLWVLQPTPGDDPIWVPFDHDDLAAEARRARAAFRRAGLRAGDVVLAATPEGPWVGNALPFLIAAADALTPDLPPLGVQVFPLAVLTVTYKPDLTVFPFGRAPSVLVGPAREIRAIADLARAAGAPPLRCRLLLLAGPPTEEFSRMAETTVSLLHLPGALAPFAGEPGADGVWLDAAVVTAEVIPDEEWGRSLQDPAYVPRAVPPPAAVGRSGELVVTIANRALPVVRFRTQHRVTVLHADEQGTRVRVVPEAG